MQSQREVQSTCHTNNEHTEADACGVIELIGLGVGSVRLRKSLANKENILRLFALGTSELILTDENGEEIALANVVGGRSYHVLSPEDLKEDSPFTMDPSLVTDKMRQQLAQKLSIRMMRMQQERISFIQENFRPKRPELYTLNRKFIDPEFLRHFDQSPQKAIEFMHQETASKLYSFPFFTDEFCSMMIEEIEHFEASGLPVSRPNSMNNYGVVLDEIGFTPFFTQLREQFISPISEILYPQEGRNLQGHHGFVVKYKIGEDTKLDFHYDSSEVTLNVCLGKEFTGGSLYFCGLLHDAASQGEMFEFQHVKGRGILHVGNHRHGANNITSGTRYNLIVWFEGPPRQCCNCSHGH